MFTSTNKGVNPLHRKALNQAMDAVNAKMASQDSDHDVIVLVSTKNIVRYFLTAVFSSRFVIPYFTGFGRLFMDYGPIGRAVFIIIVILAGFRAKRHFIVENGYDRKFIQKWTRRQVSEVSGSGFDESLFKTRRKSGITASDPLVIGHMSRFGRSKCTDEIITMIGRLPPECKVIIAGKDVRGSRYTEKFYRLAGTKPNVEMIGFLETADDVSSFFEKIDVFLYPSVREGLPISLLESIHHRTPFLTTNVAGCVDLAKEMGFPACAPQDFGTQDNHTTIERWGVYSARWDEVLKRYSVPAVQVQFEKIFNKILKTHFND